MAYDFISMGQREAEMKKPWVWVIVTFVILATPVRAASYRVIGPGSESCGRWTAEKAAEVQGGAVEVVRHEGAVFWVEGFLTGMAHDHQKVSIALSSTDAEGLEAWIDNYCAIHPLDDVSHAADALVMDLASRR